MNKCVCIYLFVNFVNFVKSCKNILTVYITDTCMFKKIHSFFLKRNTFIKNKFWCIKVLQYFYNLKSLK